MVLMPFFLRVAALTLLAALTTRVNAAPAITLPYNVTADQPTQLKIVYKIDDDSDLQKRYNAYRVFLALEPPGWGIGPVCWLAYAEDLSTTQINVTIPADVAPDKSRIRISTSLIKKGTLSVNGYSYSSRTTLYGANGTWSQRELDGRVISDENTVSCWAFGCVRQCNEHDAQADACADQCIKNLNPKGTSSAANIAPIPSALMAAVAMALARLFL